MNKSKLFANLTACKKNELADLRRFVASPFFNRQPELEALLEYLLKYWPEYEGKKLKKETLFEVACPGQPYQDKQFRYMSSALARLIEQFWAVKKWQEDGNAGDLALLDIASERDVQKTYRQVNKRLETTLNEQKSVADSRVFYEQIQWSEVTDRHFGRSRERRFDDSIQRQSDHLDRYYFLEKLKIACGMLDRQTIIAGTYQTQVSSAWEQHLLENDCFDVPAIRMYYHVWLALKNEQEEQHFLNLTENLRGPLTGIPLSDREALYRIAINYCARKIRQGSESYIATALDLYLSGLHTGALMTDGQISPWAFTNIVKLSMRLHRYAQGEAFILEYAPKLPANFRENALHYNLSELYYYTNRLDDAMLHLNKVAYSDLNYYLGARVMLAKIYYESGLEEPLLSLIAAFTIFLKRNREVSAELKQTYLNFCDLLFQLVRKHPQKITTLHARIQATPLLTDRKWLLEQYENVLKNR